MEAAVKVLTAVFWASFVIGWGACVLCICLAASDYFYTNSWLFFSLIELAAISWLAIILLVWVKAGRKKIRR